MSCQTVKYMGVLEDVEGLRHSVNITTNLRISHKTTIMQYLSVFSASALGNQHADLEHIHKY